MGRFPQLLVLFSTGESGGFVGLADSCGLRHLVHRALDTSRGLAKNHPHSGDECREPRCRSGDLGVSRDGFAQVKRL